MIKKQNKFLLLNKKSLLLMNLLKINQLHRPLELSYPVCLFHVETKEQLVVAQLSQRTLQFKTKGCGQLMQQFILQLIQKTKSYKVSKNHFKLQTETQDGFLILSVLITRFTMMKKKQANHWIEQTEQKMEVWKKKIWKWTIHMSPSQKYQVAATVKVHLIKCQKMKILIKIQKTVKWKNKDKKNSVNYNWFKTKSLKSNLKSFKENMKKVLKNRKNCI